VTGPIRNSTYDAHVLVVVIVRVSVNGTVTLCHFERLEHLIGCVFLGWVFHYLGCMRKHWLLLPYQPGIVDCACAIEYDLV